MYSDDPYRGDGLNGAFKQAITNRNATGIHTVYASINGESFWAKELGVAITRNQKALHNDVVIEHPADCFGDTGAAFSAVVLGMLTAGSPGVYLVYGSSDGAARAAMCVDVLQG